jgi:hypothetical protein
LRKKLNDSVIGVAVRRQGPRKAWRASLFLAMWGLTTQHLGRVPTMAEFIDDWPDSMATAYRNRRTFLEVFPEWTPEGLWEHLHLEVDQADDVASVVPQVVAAPLVSA